jgi:hypothetical protein
MAKIAFATAAEAPVVPQPEGFSGDGEARALFDAAAHPLHVHLHRLGRGQVLRIGPLDAHCAAFVWEGEVEAGGRRMAASSSLFVERGAEVAIRGVAEASRVLAFRAARPAARAAGAPQVHLLPAERVPRVELGGTVSGARGALHADASMPSCRVWLHENSLAPMAEDPDATERGVHSHTEDEVIFVTGGEMQLGTRRLGPGSALAIAAHTFYGFGVGPQGLSFVNFRAGQPADIRFKAGGTMDEVGFWRGNCGSPEYLAPLPA